MLTDLNAFSEVKAVTWSPDAKSLASGSDDKTVRIWDASTGQYQSTQAPTVCKVLRIHPQAT